MTIPPSLAIGFGGAALWLSFSDHAVALYSNAATRLLMALLFAVVCGGLSYLCYCYMRRPLR